MELSPTAKVILGMLRMRPRSGYEIKSFVDTSTSFFYAAGYGSIYPELKRLREAGLIEGREDPAGDRRRVVYELTEAGEQELDSWLESPTGACELRDEGLLQVFFAPDRERAADALERKAREHAKVIEELGEIEPLAADLESPYPHVSLRYGLGLHEFSQRWCEEEAARLRKGPGKARE